MGKTFPNCVKGRSVPPSLFQPIDWTKVSVWKLLLSNYEKCFKAWKQLGFHDDQIPIDIAEMSNAEMIPFVYFRLSFCVYAQSTVAGGYRYKLVCDNCEQAYFSCISK